MRNHNQVSIVGRLTRDPEISYTRENKPMARLSVACNWGKGEGEVDFFDAVAWEKTAEICGQYLQKGAKILVEGRLKQDRWDDRETGKARTAVKISVHSIEFLENRNAQDGAHGGNGGQYAPQGAPQAGRGYQGGAGRAPEGAPAQGGGYRPAGRPGARPAPRSADDFPADGFHDLQNPPANDPEVPF